MAAYRLRNIKRNTRGRIIHADIFFTAATERLSRLSGAMDEAQEIVDTEMVRHLMAYVPLKSGMLQKSIPLSTNVGSGEVVIGTPYGHYQNFLGMPYKTVPKNDPRYAGDPNRGSHFVERVITDHGEDIIEAAQKHLDSRG